MFRRNIPYVAKAQGTIFFISYMITEACMEYFLIYLAILVHENTRFLHYLSAEYYVLPLNEDESVSPREIVSI